MSRGVRRHGGLYLSPRYIMECQEARHTISIAKIYQGVSDSTADHIYRQDISRGLRRHDELYLSPRYVKGCQEAWRTISIAKIYQGVLTKLVLSEIQRVAFRLLHFLECVCVCFCVCVCLFACTYVCTRVRLSERIIGRPYKNGLR